MSRMHLTVAVFVRLPAEVVAAAIREPTWQRRCWPDAELRLHEDRTIEGIRWLLAGRPRRRWPVSSRRCWDGTCEVWIERCDPGAIVHVYERTDPAPLACEPAVRRRRHRREREITAVLTAWKDQIEAG